MFDEIKCKTKRNDILARRSSIEEMKLGVLELNLGFFFCFSFVFMFVNRKQN